jgi:hypothetical protein
LPLPNGKEYSLVDSGGYNLTDSFNIFKEQYKNLNNVNELDVNTLLLFESMLKEIEYIEPDITLDIISEEDKQLALEFISLINDHNLSEEFIDKENAVKNSIIATTKRIVSAPSNRLLASSPIDDALEAHKKGAEKAATQYNIKERDLSSYDMISYYKQQYDASVGKDDVGIGANGLKVFFNLSNYFNNWFDTEGYLSGNLLTSPYSFKKSLFINGKDYNIHSISDTRTLKGFTNHLKEVYQYKDDELSLLNNDAALIISGFVSGATDNAKELIMAKINAIVELSGMHLYMYSLGFTPEDVALFMNSDLARFIARELQTNKFDVASTEESHILSLIDTYIKDNNLTEDQLKEVESFRDIYYGGQEYKILASILKVNQRTRANIAELHKFFSRFENAMFTREHAVLGMNLSKLKTFGEKYVKVPKYSELYKKEKDLVDTIITKNEVLTENERDYVTEVLFNSRNIKVVDPNNESVNITTSILGGGFDFRHYLNSNNEEYIEATINYYNLFKNTINIFHVIQNSPHFKQMINGAFQTHRSLNKTSKKYNFIFSDFKDILKRKSLELYNNNKQLVKYSLGNKAFNVKVDEQTINKASITFDKFAVKK